MPPLSLDLTLLLIISSFFTSFITATAGLGGGLALLAILASVLPSQALIAVHGVVQLGSNSGRAWLYRQTMNWSVLRRFAAGAVIGAAIGASVAATVPAPILRISVGVFVLYALWSPSPRLTKAGPWYDRIGGFIATFLTMFFGATGPFVTALIAPRNWPKSVYMGTFAGCMMTQHVLKSVAFGMVGFDFAPWVGLISAMVLTGYAGTFVGTAVLNRLPEKVFRALLKYGVSAIALNLIYQGVAQII